MGRSRHSNITPTYKVWSKDLQRMIFRLLYVDRDDWVFVSLRALSRANICKSIFIMWEKTKPNDIGLIVGIVDVDCLINL